MREYFRENKVEIQIKNRKTFKNEKIYQNNPKKNLILWVKIKVQRKCELFKPEKYNVENVFFNQITNTEV